MKIGELTTQLGLLEASENRIQNIEKQLLQRESELNEFKSDNNSSKLDSEIKSLTQDKKAKESTLAQLKEEENIMLQQSEAQTKITMMESEKARMEDSFNNMWVWFIGKKLPTNGNQKKVVKLGSHRAFITYTIDNGV